MPAVEEDPAPTVADASAPAAPPDPPASDDGAEASEGDGEDSAESMSDASLYDDILESTTPNFEYGLGKSAQPRLARRGGVLTCR
jgi:hypothetical protein